MNRKANIGMTLIVILSFILLSYATLVFSSNVSREGKHLTDFVEVLKMKREVGIAEDFLDGVALSCFIESYSLVLENGEYMKHPFGYLGNSNFLGLSEIKDEAEIEKILFSSFDKCFTNKVSSSLPSFSGTIELKDNFYKNIVDNYFFELKEDKLNIFSKKNLFYFRKDSLDRIYLNYSLSYNYIFNLNEGGLIGFKELENLRKGCEGIKEKDLIKECFSSLNNNFIFEVDSFFIGQENNKEEKFIVKLESKKSFQGKKLKFGFILV
jgi:hypothetical protein